MTDDQTVTQEARDAAVRFTQDIGARTGSERAAMLNGYADNDCYVVFAADLLNRHRTAHSGDLAPGLERAAHSGERLKEPVREYENLAAKAFTGEGRETCVNCDGGGITRDDNPCMACGGSGTRTAARTGEGWWRHTDPSLDALYSVSDSITHWCEYPSIHALAQPEGTKSE